MKSLPKAALIGYAIAAVVCFGPATVEEDFLEAAKKAECEASREEVHVHVCKTWARNEFRPLMKSMFWPFYLSYRLAIAVSSPLPSTQPTIKDKP